MAITKLMDEKDEALALVPHHQKDNDKLQTEVPCPLLASHLQRWKGANRNVEVWHGAAGNGP
jgi:hypothetical protein